MTFSPSEVILGASVPMANGSSITFSVSGHIETERDCDDAVVIFSRKLLKYTNSASDEDRLTVRQVVASITSTPLNKVPDVGTPAPEPARPTHVEYRCTAHDDRIPPAATTCPTVIPENLVYLRRRCTTIPEPAAPGEEVCEKCGGPVPGQQAKLSQLFQGKTLCKGCMGGAE